MEVAVFQQLLAQRARRAVRIRQKRVLDDDCSPSARLQRLDDMLQKQKRRFPRLDREVLLDLGAFLAAKGWIGENYVKTILVLDIADVFGKRVSVNDVRRFDAMQ